MELGFKRSPLEQWREVRNYRKDMSVLIAQMVKRLSTMWETQARALGWEDPLKKEMAIQLPGKSHGQRSPLATVYGVTKSRTQLRMHAKEKKRGMSFLFFPFFENKGDKENSEQA